MRWQFIWTNYNDCTIGFVLCVFVPTQQISHTFFDLSQACSPWNMSRIVEQIFCLVQAAEITSVLYSVYTWTWRFLSSDNNRRCMFSLSSASGDQISFRVYDRRSFRHSSRIWDQNKHKTSPNETVCKPVYFSMILCKIMVSKACGLLTIPETLGVVQCH